ncbi:S-layer homology domain-containing protein [Aedoeadaptatus pacaensis]|uniref:S-layer homology domain-containing protein n=1 Tax=Aedoeadaptatus pacaensis TaxID=1776390 RepID=UPI0008380340|nr:S-layer homology domain-containing protein [Peptoniphilus pacaensis]
MKKIIALMLAVVMLLGNVPVALAQSGGQMKAPLMVMLSKDGDVLQENVTFEILDGNSVVEEVSLENGMGFVNNCEIGKTYTVRVSSPAKYEAETKFFKVIDFEGMAAPCFTQTEDEAISEAQPLLKIKEKTTLVQPKTPLPTFLSQDNQLATAPLSVEVLDNGQVIDTIHYDNGVGSATKYEIGKVYALHIKVNSNYELVTKYMTIVSGGDSAGTHFLKTADETPSKANAINLCIKAKSADTPQVSEGLDQLDIKVKIDGELKEGIGLRINYWDRIIPTIIAQPKTDANGSYVLKDLKPNAKYTVVMYNSVYNFSQDTFEVLTDKNGKIVSVAGHPASEYKDGLVIEGVDRSSSAMDNVEVELKVVDKKTGKPQEGVEVTANIITPRLRSYKDVKSDKNGVLRFKLSGNDEGKVYAMTVSKNHQFFWDFEPELIEVKVFKDGYDILETKDNLNAENIMRVTSNDRSYLREDLKVLVDKAQGMLDSGKYTDASMKDLKVAAQGGVAELAKAETIPYYVQGHMDNIKKAMEKLVLKEESKPNPSKPDPKPNPNPSTPKAKDEGRHYFVPSASAATEKKEDKKASVEAKNKIAVPYRNLPVTLTDIPANEKGDAIRTMVERGILVGMGNDKFEPKTTISRAMVTAVFMRISMDQTIKSPAAFTDVKDKAWYERSVKWASTNGLIKGYEDGSFKPNKKVSYEEFAVMLDNLLKEYKLDLPKVKTVNKADFDYVNDWSRDSVVHMIELGLMKTDGNGKVQPKGEYSRADLAETLNQLIQWSDKNK